jgi:aminoglycoside phosphotransferase (APT) family kinase protein
MTSVTDFLTANWDSLSLGQFGRPPLSAVVLTPGFRASANVICLLFPEGESQPALVAKVSRLPGENSELRREAESLEKVQQATTSGFNSIPRLVAFREEDDHSFLVETAINGSLLNPATVRQNRSAAIDSVFDWLTDLGRATATPCDQDQEWFSRLISQPLNRLRTVLPTSPEATLLLDRSWDVSVELAKLDFPLVFEHGDLSDPNLLTLRDGSIGVVDWELAQPNSLPAGDLFFFLTYVAFSQRHATKPSDYLAAFHDAFFGTNAWAMPYILKYAQLLQIPGRALPPLFLASWVRYFEKLTRRLDPGKNNMLAADTHRWLKENRYYSLWKYTVEHWTELKWNRITNS